MKLRKGRHAAPAGVWTINPDLGYPSWVKRRLERDPGESNRRSVHNILVANFPPYVAEAFARDYPLTPTPKEPTVAATPQIKFELDPESVKKLQAASERFAEALKVAGERVTEALTVAFDKAAEAIAASSANVATPGQEAPGEAWQVRYHGRARDSNEVRHFETRDDADTFLDVLEEEAEQFGTIVGSIWYAGEQVERFSLKGPEIVPTSKCVHCGETIRYIRGINTEHVAWRHERPEVWMGQTTNPRHRPVSCRPRPGLRTDATPPA